MSALLTQMLGEDHGEADMSNPEEAREVQIARRLKTLANQADMASNQSREGRAIARDIRELADELLQMHGQASAPPGEPPKVQ